jgi:hypothetical protein
LGGGDVSVDAAGWVWSGEAVDSVFVSCGAAGNSTSDTGNGDFWVMVMLASMMLGGFGPVKLLIVMVAAVSGDVGIGRVGFGAVCNVDVV